MAEAFVWPSTPKDQKDLKEKIDNAVNLMIEIDVLKSDISSLAEDSKADFGISSSEFNKYVKASYDTCKFLEAKNKLEEIASNLNLK